MTDEMLLESWHDLLTKWHHNLAQKPKQVSSLCRKGIPEPLRGEVWQLLAGVGDSKELLESYRVLISKVSRWQIDILRVSWGSSLETWEDRLTTTTTVDNSLIILWWTLYWYNNVKLLYFIVQLPPDNWVISYCIFWSWVISCCISELYLIVYLVK